MSRFANLAVSPGITEDNGMCSSFPFLRVRTPSQANNVQGTIPTDRNIKTIKQLFELTRAEQLTGESVSLSLG